MTTATTNERAVQPAAKRSITALDAAFRSRQRRRHKAVVNLATTLGALGFGATLGLGVTSESLGALAAAGGVDTAIGRVTGLAGTYLILLMVLLMARIPMVERAVGQDRLARWHRRLGPWPIGLITAHVVFVTFGYAESSRWGFWHEFGIFLNSYPDMLAATVGLALLVVAGLASARVVRRHLRYETWWAIHLYMYLALALSFAHQIVTGVPFVGHPFARAIWATAWAATAGTVVAFRVMLPIARSLRHQLSVVVVKEEAPGVVSIVLRGRRLDRLRVEGGEFFQWRFLQRGLWWQAHPYSLSAVPSPPYLRVTIRSTGDHGRALARLRPGTRVAIEGPYGTFTRSRRDHDGVLLVAAGIGVTAIRALLEALPDHVNAEIIVRGSSRDELVLHHEFTKLVEARSDATLHEVIGPRTRARLDARTLGELVPDVARRDVYVCGPDGFTQQFVSAARRLGVPAERIHCEAFSF